MIDDPSKLVPVHFWVDGSSPNNNGLAEGGQPAGAGIVAVAGSYRKVWGVYLGEGLNGYAEVQAVRHALLSLKDRSRCAVTIHTDSQYVIGAVNNEHWLLRKNVTEVLEVRELVKECGSCRFVHVKGHQGDENNETADRMAGLASKHRHDWIHFVV